MALAPENAQVFSFSYLIFRHVGRQDEGKKNGKKDTFGSYSGAILCSHTHTHI